MNCMKCQKGIPDGSKFCNFCGCRQNKPHAPGRHCLHFRFKDPISGLSKDKYVYGKTRAEAEKKKRQFLLQVDQGLRMSEQGYSFAQWADEWLKTYKLNKVKPGTYATYAADVHRMNAHLGNKPLSTILPIDIVRLMDTRRGLSASAIRKTYITINAIMTAALDNRLITHNPCRGVAIPQGSSGTHRAITQDEIDLILSVARDGHRFALPVMLMLFAGLRRGEAAGIKSSDIKGQEIHIQRSVYWTSNQPNEGPPKSQAGVRTVPIFPPLRPFLKFTGYAAKPFNCTLAQGPITLQSFERGYESFMRACEEKMNGFSKQKKPADYDWKRLDIRTHDLRHTFATMLYDAGVDLKTAQRWLGHADPSVTLKIYTHLTDTRHSAAVSTAGEYLRQVTCTVL